MAVQKTNKSYKYAVMCHRSMDGSPPPTYREAQEQVWSFHNSRKEAEKEAVKRSTKRPYGYYYVVEC